MQDDEMTTPGGDDALGAVLARAGARSRPADADWVAVRAAAEAAWREQVAMRRRKRMGVSWAAAAAVAAVAVTAWFLRPEGVAEGEPFATLARAQGTVEYRAAGQGAWRHVGDGERLATRSSLRTGEGGRAALTLDSGIELRLDHGTELAFAAPGQASLQHGGVYVDAGADGHSQARDFTLATDYGDVRHLGTQYEARQLDGGLRVAVREGRVGVGGPADGYVAEAGEQLVVSAGGASRSTLSPHDSQWSWVAAVTPPFAIEGRSLESFLAWAARETGREVVYASPEAAGRAREIVLRGSVSGLTPDEAVRAVMATTPLAPTLEAARIEVE